MPIIGGPTGSSGSGQPFAPVPGSENPLPSPPRLPFGRLSGYYFCYFAFIGAFSPYFGLYLQAHRFSAWEIAVLLSQMQLMRVVAPNVWGWLADHSGRRVGIVRLASVMSLVGFSLCFVADSFSAWLIAMAVLAFFWGAALPLVEAITLDHLTGAAERYSRVRLWGSVGFIAAVLATGWLLDSQSLDALLWILLALLGGIVVCALRLPEAPIHRHADAAGVPLASVLRQARVRALLLACFAMSAAHGALYVFYSIYVADFGYSRTAVGALWSLGVIAEIGVFLAMAQVMRRHSLRTILVVCFLAAALRFLMIGWGARHWPVLVAAQCLHGLSFGAYHAASIAAINAWFPRACQGRGQALYSSVSFGAGGLFGGILAGALWDSWGGATTYTVSAVFALAGAVVIAYGVGGEARADKAGSHP